MLALLVGPFAAGPTPPPITRDGARRAAQEELSKPAYHAHDPSTTSRALQWLFGRIGHAFEVAARHAPGKGVGLVGVFVLVAVIVAVVAARVGRLRRTVNAPPPVFGDEIAAASDHRARAQGYAHQQEWAQAVREWLRAIARELEERCVLDPRPGRTAAELCAEASAALPGAADELRLATSAFDAIWYGGRPATPADEDVLRNVDRRIAGSHRGLTAASHSAFPTAVAPR